MKDVEKSLQFYRNVLGFDLAYRWPNEGGIEYGFLRLGEIAVWIVSEAMVEKLLQTSMQRRDSLKLKLCIKVDEEATADRLAQKCGNLSVAASQHDGTGQAAVIEDPDGNRICIQTKRP